MSEELPEIETQNPTVEGEVPGSQNLREVTIENSGENTDGAVSNIAENQNGGTYRVVKRSYTETRSEMVQGSQVTATTTRLSYDGDTGLDLKQGIVEVEERKQKTKIPKLKFKQTVEKVREKQKALETFEDNESQKSKIHRRSKIPPPTTKPIVTKRNSALMDDEFEKIYEDLIDEQFNFDDQLLGDNIVDEEKVEMKFKEIVHDYDENKVQPINVEAVRQSRIPYRRQKSEHSDTKSMENDTHGTKVASSIPLLRSKSEHDTERITYKFREDGKEKAKYSSSIPLPRRKSGQDGELTKTVYNKSEKDGVITETMTTITKTAPVTVTLERGSVSTYETTTDKQSNEHNPNIETKTKVRKSIPRLIGSKNDGRKVIRTYTRTFTTEKVESGKNKQSNDVNIHEQTEPETAELKDTAKIINETTIDQKENHKNVTMHTQQEESIVKDSIRIGIPSLESMSENNEESIQTVEVTKILEWNTNIDESTPNKINCPILQTKREIIQTQNEDYINNDHKNEEFMEAINLTEHSQLIKSDTQDLVNTEENKSFSNTEKTKDISKVTSITISTFEKQISSETELSKEVNVKERDGSRFNKVSNLTTLKGIDNDDEFLTSPKLLISNKTEPEYEFKTSASVHVNLNTEDTKDTKLYEQLKSPKSDKDGYVDLLPEYNIRIKRYSREMKHADGSLAQSEGDNQVTEKINIDQNNRPVETNRSTETNITRGKLDISNMDNTRNILSRVLDREKKIDTIKSKEEIKQINITSAVSEEKISSIKNSDISFKETVPNDHVSQARTEFIVGKTYEATNIENNRDVKISQKYNKEDVEELRIIGKVERLINKIDSKEISTDAKKEGESPVRRSVLSKIAMFERHESLDNIQARKHKRDSKPPKLTIKEALSPTRVHVHTPKIVEEVLKTADWDLKTDDEKTEIAWKIDFNKIVPRREDINATTYNENSEIFSTYQIQRPESVVKSDDIINSKTNDIKINSNFSSEEKKVDITSDTTNNTINENQTTSVTSDFKVEINNDGKTVNLVHEDVAKAEINRNKLEKPTVKDMATSPIRLSFNAHDLKDKVKNQVITDAPVIIVHSNENLSKSTEGVFSTQTKFDKNNNKKVNRTTSMTEKLYPEKVKANIALYESIKNKSYSNTNKLESKGIERASSTIIFETYKHERYDKANKVDNHVPYTPQNSINSDLVTNEDSKRDTYQHKYETSVSVDESRFNTRIESSNAKYGSLQHINESVNTESITDTNKSIYRLTFDDSTSNQELIDVVGTNSKEQDNENNVKEFEEIGVKPVNEIIYESYKVYSKNGTNEKVTDRKFKSYRSKYDDDKTGEQMMRSLPNMELGDIVKSKVRMVARQSTDRYEGKKELFNIKELPRKLSVLEKIALFEGKAHQSKVEQTTTRSCTNLTIKPSTQRQLSEKEYHERIEELKTAKQKYGSITEMPTLTLRTGQKMPVLAVGTAVMDPKLLKDIIGAAIDLGYRAIDTAYIYGNEKEVGEAIKAKIQDGTVTRGDLFIIGKLWSTFHRTDLVETACRASLEAMGLGYFDLYLIHNPMSLKEGSDPLPKIATVLQYSEHDYLDAWYGMETVVSKGLAKAIGVSNFNSVQIQRIMDKGKVHPSVNQVECHPYLSQQRLDHFCAERHIKLSCFGTLGSKGTPNEYKSTLAPVIDDALVKVMASGLNVTAAQLLIRYQLDSERAVIVKSSSAAHLWDNLQALTFRLTHGQMDALHALNRNKRTFLFIGMGDTHKNYPFKIAF